MTSLIYSSTILPSGFFYSETDEEDKTVSKSCLADCIIVIVYAYIQYFQARVPSSGHNHDSSISNLCLPTPFNDSRHRNNLHIHKHGCLFRRNTSRNISELIMLDRDTDTHSDGRLCGLRHYDDDYCRLGYFGFLLADGCVVLPV